MSGVRENTTDARMTHPDNETPGTCRGPNRCVAGTRAQPFPLRLMPCIIHRSPVEMGVELVALPSCNHSGAALAWPTNRQKPHIW